MFVVSWPSMDSWVRAYAANPAPAIGGEVHRIVVVVEPHQRQRVGRRGPLDAGVEGGRRDQGDPIPVMAQAVIENALSPRVVDQLFEDTADAQYTRDLLFSSVVGLMSLVVCRIRPSINAAYQKNAVPIGASLKALYGKIQRI